jgi:hypothetical protein
MKQGDQKGLKNKFKKGGMEEEFSKSTPSANIAISPPENAVERFICRQCITRRICDYTSLLSLSVVKRLITFEVVLLLFFCASTLVMDFISVIIVFLS